jgi:peptidoglycan/LPS O-acetylase OafA/YrhL
LFFVLSGFVLNLPFLEQRAQGYGAFAIRRVCRIYLPYLAAVIASSILFTLLAGSTPAGLSTWFTTMWAQPLTVTSIIGLIFMMGWSSHNIDTSTWSLVHEMRISLVFPLLAWFVNRSNWMVSLGLGALGSALFALTWFNTSATGSFLGYFTIHQTAYYAAFFILGAVLAKHRQVVTEKLKASSTLTKCALLVASIVLFNWRWEFPSCVIPGLDSNFCTDWAAAWGSATLMMLSLSSRRLAAVLSLPACLWLGRVSYSLYLIHVVVLLTLVHTLGYWIPLPIAVAMVPLLSLLGAAVLHRWVEVPSMQLGRRLTSGSRLVHRDEVRPAA